MNRQVSSGEVLSARPVQGGKGRQAGGDGDGDGWLSRTGPTLSRGAQIMLRVPDHTRAAREERYRNSAEAVKKRLHRAMPRPRRPEEQHLQERSDKHAGRGGWRARQQGVPRAAGRRRPALGLWPTGRPSSEGLWSTPCLVLLHYFCSTASNPHTEGQGFLPEQASSPSCPH